MVKKLYQFPACEEILQLSLPKTPDIKDRLLWKHSTSREYKVNKAYHMLHQNHYPSYVQDQRPYGVSHIAWVDLESETSIEDSYFYLETPT